MEEEDIAVNQTLQCQIFHMPFPLEKHTCFIFVEKKKDKKLTCLGLWVVLEVWDVRLVFYFLSMKTLEKKFLNSEDKTEQPVDLYLKFLVDVRLNVNKH